MGRKAFEFTSSSLAIKAIGLGLGLPTNLRLDTTVDGFVTFAMVLTFGLIDSFPTLLAFDDISVTTMDLWAPQQPNDK